MAKARVFELAKELGVESTTILSTLKDMGEFVRSASSTVEPSIVRRLTDGMRNHPPSNSSRPARVAATQTTSRESMADRPTSRTLRASRDRPQRQVPELRLDLPIPQGNRGRRHKGTIPELVGIVLDDMGASRPPFEDEYQAAAKMATEWGRLYCEPSDVRAWRKLGVTGAHTAAMFLHHGITPELCKARPWNTNRPIPAKTRS